MCSKVEGGMTTSGYGGEDTWKIRVSATALLVTKSFHLMPRIVEYLIGMSYGMPAASASLCSTDIND